MPTFQYSHLPHQTQAVDSIAEVFANVGFAMDADNRYANPTLMANSAHLQANIVRIRAQNHITAGDLVCDNNLSLDILMETGTGKTFTFIAAIHRLHRHYRLAKFIVLVPSNAIRLGTLKSLQTTASFFAREYDNQKINVFNYSEKTVQGFIHASNSGISVLVATYQSFNKDKNTINQRGVEANLFGHAKSYMEALAAIRPVLIIDEPHRFEGAQTQSYLAKFCPLFTLRFGATFKDRAYTNLIYTLDSPSAFAQGLVKGIDVDAVGVVGNTITLCLQAVSGGMGQRLGTVQYQTATDKSKSVEMQKNDNLGDKTGLAFLNGYVVEDITLKELRFSNGFSLSLLAEVNCGALADEVQSLIIQRSIINHFEREEWLFQRGIKALSLFFIDAVAKYLPLANHPAVLRELFEKHYRTQLNATLAKADLDPSYRAYLMRTAQDLGRVHKGYFARSHTEKGEEEAIKLILQDKEKLLSFDTDLRFIFSMWALQEGWDNPNVFTLCKLAPSPSSISKLQQIGRGLRLAVNQQLERITANDDEFGAINRLTVVVPNSEGDFVAAIQSEMSAHSVGGVARTFSDQTLVSYGVAYTTRTANKVLDTLAALGIVSINDANGEATLLLNQADYQAQRAMMQTKVAEIAHAHADKLVACLDAYYQSAGRVRLKENRRQAMLTPDPARYKAFKNLWQNLNRDAVLHYDLDGQQLINNAVASINQQFTVPALQMSVTHYQHVEKTHANTQHSTTQTTYRQSLYHLHDFIRELAQQTRLSIHTITAILQAMSAGKFAQIKHNEHRALQTLRELIVREVYALLVNKVSYELREIRVKTALTDNTGTLLKTIPASSCGDEIHAIKNQALRSVSLYQEHFVPVDSQIERTTIDEANNLAILVFAKLPRINIPTPDGHYNPDFGYVIQQNEHSQALYLVVETKGYDHESDIPSDEQQKISSAKCFFDALKQRGMKVSFYTKINATKLAELIDQCVGDPDSLPSK
ncbi:MAG: DEAD/DEAH box helicase family protein [Methylophilaceae bacterium]|nr:DEAD/DEAH box helicase family protein [Methylophilaceae bacterium]